MRALRRILFAMSAAVMIVVLAEPAGVRAAPMRSADLPLTWTVANGPACGGFVTGNARSVPRLHHEDGSTTDNRGVTRFHVSGSFAGISGTAHPCDVAVTVHWVNRASGKSGRFQGRVSGVISPIPTPGQGLARSVRTGSGPVDFWVVPGQPHVAAGSARIVVY